MSALPAALPGGLSFADIAERLNPAVVSISATSRGEARRRPAQPPDRPEPFLQRPQRGRNLSMYLYKPEINQRALETLKIDER